MKTDIEKQLRSVSISPDGDVKIKFAEVVTGEAAEGTDESTVKQNIFTVQSGNKPHKDFTDSMKKLRKFALEVCEMPIPENSKHLGQYTVSGIKISGDLTMKQSRVVLTIAKTIERTGKVVKIVTPQVTMYGESEYPNADKMTEIIEDAIEEAWSYLNGKYADESNGQLPLFERHMLEVVQ